MGGEEIPQQDGRPACAPRRRWRRHHNQRGDRRRLRGRRRHRDHQGLWQKSAIEISSSGWEDAVVWNPYGNEGMGYDSFVCVEAAKALKPITVAPGKDWEGVMNVKQV